MSARAASRSIGILFLGGLLAGCGGGKREVSPAPATADPALEAISTLAAAEAERLGVPGLGVGVLRRGELVSVQGYGSLPRANEIDADTVFRIGSITKVFTAMAALVLRDAGKLSLDAPVAAHIPELAALLSPPGEEPVRIVHLLQHSSGIPTLGDGTLDWTGTTGIDEAELIASVANSALRFAPGSQFEYSNVGMALAGVVVARVSGMPYRQYVQERILEPLGMRRTRWQRDAYSAPEVFPGFVAGKDGFEPSPGDWVLGAVEGAGGLYSTIGDLALFLSFQAGARAVEGVLSRKSVLEGQTKASRPRGSEIALGWIIESDPDLAAIVSHNGATYAYGAWVGIDPATKNAAIVFVSTGDLQVVKRAELIGKDALRILAGHAPHYTARALGGGGESDPEVVATVGARLLGVLGLLGSSAPPPDVEAVFSRSFLAEIPPERLRTFLGEVAAQSGTCASFELLRDAGGGRLELRLRCEKGDLRATAVVGAAPDYLLDGLFIAPVAAP